MTAQATRKLKVFLCHSSHDKPAVREIYARLKAEGWIDPWLDEEKLFPGQDWDLEIEKAVEETDAVLVFLSDKSVNKKGYVQKELKFVLDIAEYFPEGNIFILPFRLEECPVPRRLRSWHYVDNFPEDRKEWAYGKLLGSLKLRAKKLEIDIDSIFKKNAKKRKQELVEKARKEKAEREYIENHNKDRAVEASSLQFKGILAQNAGKYNEAEKLFRQSLDIAKQLNDSEGKANILRQLSILAQDRSNHEKEAHKVAEKERKEKEAEEERERKTATEKAIQEKIAREKRKVDGKTQRTSTFIDQRLEKDTSQIKYKKSNFGEGKSKLTLPLNKKGELSRSQLINARKDKLFFFLVMLVLAGLSVGLSFISFIVVDEIIGVLIFLIGIFGAIWFGAGSIALAMKKITVEKVTGKIMLKEHEKIFVDEKRFNFSKKDTDLLQKIDGRTRTLYITTLGFQDQLLSYE